ncbi:CotH kinase family protein [Flavobacterium sp.]|uniref:CotH kinase family protein n=1 Tax=Flavobacterium sp. TaxID=239 RepID=UPI00374CE21F
MIKFYSAKFITFSKIILMLLLGAFTKVASQTLIDSNLPIVIIRTNIDSTTYRFQKIIDEPRIIASMKIICHPDGNRNYVSDQDKAESLNYNGRISIEVRGSSSQDLPKKSYGLTTILSENNNKNNISLLGMPSEHDWILNSLAYDPSGIRDYISYNLARELGDYATRTAFCEVIINDEYKGLYLLQEKIKPDLNRVNIVKISREDTTMPNVSGGYITKVDRTNLDEKEAWIIDDTKFIHVFPKPKDITDQQDLYIHHEFEKLAKTALSGNVSPQDGYPSVIDVPSFIDFMLINELSSNADAYQFSTFFHKDRNGKLRAGPIWDMNLTFGNDMFLYGADRSKTNVWQFWNKSNEGPEFWKDLYNNPTFNCYLSQRWNELILPGKPMNGYVLNSFIDKSVAHISEALIRENELWGTIPNHAKEIANIKAFINERITWITNNIGICKVLSKPIIPKLVITKINYNPIVSDDQEFIEIKNISKNKVNLSGIYFKELGITYQFPYGSMLKAHESLFLVNNSAIFLEKYGFEPFGEFTRDLSNKTEKLILADAFGNCIDTVEYLNTEPWPIDANGKGSYLQLKDSALDNNLPTSWFASTQVLLLNKNR